MNLILQGFTVPPSIVENIATLVQAQHLAVIHAGNGNAWRCEQVLYTETVKAKVDLMCHAAQLDYAFVAPGRRLSDFKLLVMDMDSTLITIECIDEIADMQGLKPQVAAITEAAMRGELEFNESLTRRVTLLKNLDATALQRVYDERLQLSVGATTMITAIKAAGLKTLLVSGGFTYFTDRIKTRLGLDYTHANQLDIVDGKLTGNLLGEIVNADEKKNMVERVCAELAISPAQTIVMGDGANDLKMMKIAGLSLAFHAKPIVQAQADIALNFVGLDGILPILN